MAFIYADHPARFSEATEVLVVATVRELVPAKFLTPYHHRQGREPARRSVTRQRHRDFLFIWQPGLNLRPGADD